MPQRTDPNTDQWWGVQDARKRKQIQDRLAQRVRRRAPSDSRYWDFGWKIFDIRLTMRTGQKLAKLSSEGSDPPSTSKHLAKKENRSLSDMTPLVSPPEDLSKCDNVYHLSDPTITVHSALFHHGVILNIACGASSIAKSLPAPSHVPLSLRPLDIQLKCVHFQFIDRFPLPTMRRNMIEKADEINVEEFLADLFGTATFVITPGSLSWDEKAWRATPGFRRKWGFLLEEGANASVWADATRFEHCSISLDFG